MYAVILAGGGGTRLRPLSRDDRPKPFLPLLGQRTLLQQTVRRLRGLVDPENIHVVTHTRYARLVRSQVPDIGSVLEEPAGRNTASAIALATLAIERPEDDVMLVLPADHAIALEGIFQRVLMSAATHLATGAFGIPAPLVTLGIQVDRPATEYGYLVPVVDRGDIVDGLQAYPLLAFEEKPSAARAEALRHEAGIAWNAGMFLWRRQAIRNALAESSHLLPALAPAVRSGGRDTLARAYDRLPSISIDYAVMEPAARSGNVVMASMDVGWSDIGGWTALLAAIGAQGEGRVVPPGHVAEVGPDDLAVVTVSGRLAIQPGPGTIRSDGPVALLSRAAADRERVEELLARVAAKEAKECVTTVAEVPAPAHILFGTDGWRAKIADEFTFESVRRCADGVAEYVISTGGQAKGVVIAYDRRFASEHFAQAAAEVILARDIPVAFAAQAVPTQMSSYEVVQRGSAAGIVITASHNPWTDNGFKVKSAEGSAAGPEILKVLEARIAQNGGIAIERRPFADAEAAGLVDRFDPFEGYERFLRRTLDLDALRAADIDVLVEPMWGAGAGWIPRLLAGGRIRVTEIHRERNPYFGGVNPEPIRPNIDESLGILARGSYDLGLLLDGDADRAGAADETGRFIHQLEVFGLLMYYLVEHRGLRAPVVKSVNTTSMAERLGERYSVPVYETPVGFKFVGPKMIETGAMMGGEESGGFGFGMHLPERDGIYTDLILLDLFLRERAAGRWPVSKAIAHLHDIAGPSFYQRVDVHVARDVYPALKARLLVELRTNAPTALAGQPVTRTDTLTTNDGFKFSIADGSWLLVRFSGTEPLVRVYTEATSQDAADAIIRAGEQLVREA